MVAGQPPEKATVSSGTVFRSAAKGREVSDIPAPAVGPTWYIHRADLLEMLRQGAEEAGVTLHLGRMVTPGVLGHDLIIASDGGRSVWRSHVDGPDSAQFTGQVAWRALLKGDWSQASNKATVSMGHRAHVVNYPLRQGRLMNLVARGTQFLERGRMATSRCFC